MAFKKTRQQADIGMNVDNNKSEYIIKLKRYKKIIILLIKMHVHGSEAKI